MAADDRCGDNHRHARRRASPADDHALPDADDRRVRVRDPRPHVQVEARGRARDPDDLRGDGAAAVGSGGDGGGAGLGSGHPRSRNALMGRLDEVDLSLDYGKEEGERELERAQMRLAQLRLTLGGQIGEKEIGPPLAVVFEGWDASGKGGAIMRMVAKLDPRHVKVTSYAAPTPDEKRHHFLW